MKNAIEFLTKEELKETIKDCISISLTSHLLNSNTKDDGFITYNEAVKYLKVSKPTFVKIKRYFPNYRVTANRILFKKSDLDDYLESTKC